MLHDLHPLLPLQIANGHFSGIRSQELEAKNLDNSEKSGRLVSMLIDKRGTV